MFEVEPKHIDHLESHESGVKIASGQWSVTNPKAVAMIYAKDWVDLGVQGFEQTKRSFTLLHGDARLALFDAETIMLRDAIEKNFATAVQSNSSLGPNCGLLLWARKRTFRSMTRLRPEVTAR